MDDYSSDDDMESFQFEVENFQDNATRTICENYVGYTANDNETAWVVDLAMTSPLPEGWKLYRTSKGKLWFFNPETKQLQETRPFAQEFKGMAERQKRLSHDETVVSPEECAFSSVKNHNDTSESVENELNRLEEQRQHKIKSVKSKFQQEIQTLKEHHRSHVLQIKNQQRHEIEALIKEVDSVRAQRKLMKCSSARNQYRIAVQKFVDDFETEKKFQITSLEGELADVRDQYETKLHEMKITYDRELAEHKEKLLEMRREHKQELEALRSDLEMRKKAELLNFERDMIEEKRKILRQQLKEKQHKLELCNAKIVSITSKPSFRRLRISPTNGLSIYDDPMEFCELGFPEAIFDCPPAESDKASFYSSTLTEIPPFGSFKNKVTFHDEEPEPEIVLQPVIQEKVRQYKSVFMTPQPVRIHRRYSSRRL